MPRTSDTHAHTKPTEHERPPKTQMRTSSKRWHLLVPVPPRSGSVEEKDEHRRLLRARLRSERTSAKVETHTELSARVSLCVRVRTAREQLRRTVCVSERVRVLLCAALLRDERCLVASAPAPSDTPRAPRSPRSLSPTDGKNS